MWIDQCIDASFIWIILSTLFANKSLIERAFPNESISRSCVKGNCLNGFGKLKYSNGHWYEGNFANGVYHGKGIFKSDKERYEGYYYKGARHGKGIHLEANGNRYEVDFINNMKHGKGIFTSCNVRYEGEWKSNLPNEKGVLIQDGTRYIGEVKDDFLMGTGMKYEGHWKDGQFHGKGILIIYDGTDGMGGSRYDGEWANGEKHGYGILYNPDGEIIAKGKWSKGKFLGR